MANKLRKNLEIQNYAFKLKETYTSWVYFRNELLRTCGKKLKQVRAEVQALRIERDENVVDFCNRALAILTQPAATFGEREVVQMLWMKMPNWV